MINSWKSCICQFSSKPTKTAYTTVSCLLFKGCHSWDKTIDEAMKNILEVIEMYLEETKIENLNTFIGFRELEVIQDAKLPAIDSQLRALVYSNEVPFESHRDP